MSEWISVEDRRPSSVETTLVYTEYKEIITDVFSPIHQAWVHEDTVTHWMPLPEPPKD